MAYGEGRHSPKLIRRAILGPNLVGTRFAERKVPVVVTVKRDLSFKGKGRYAAIACIGRKSTRNPFNAPQIRNQRCGFIAVGPNPSRALKGALRKLAQRSL